MIRVKKHEIQTALVGFVGFQKEDGTTIGGIGNEKLPPKAAYRVGRLIAKLRTEMREMEKTKRQILLNLGGEVSGNSVSLPRPVREKEESEEAFRKREEEWKEKWRRFDQQVTALLEEEASVDYDRIPLGLFEEGNPDKIPNLSPNELSAVEPFVAENSD